MQWEFIVALALAIPILLFPVALVWFLNVGGVFSAFKGAARKRRTGEEEKLETGKI